ERARRHAPELRFTTRLEPCKVSGAATRLERAVDNVLDNALKWSPPGGAIDVQLASRVLTITDHGPGIHPPDPPHLCDRFYRAPSAGGMRGGGLGLAMVKQTVEDQGGSVEIETADGGGTAVSLPFSP